MLLYSIIRYSLISEMGGKLVSIVAKDFLLSKMLLCFNDYRIEVTDDQLSSHSSVTNLTLS